MTKRLGPAVMVALFAFGAGCTPGPGVTVSTGASVITTVTAAPSPATGPSGTETFDEFVENSFEELTRRQPQLVTVLGLNAAYGTRPDQLDDLSPEYALATAKVAESVLSRLHDYDPEVLSPDQQITYRAFEWQLETTIAANEFRLLEWPVHFLANSYNEVLISLFMSVHPLTRPDEIEAYIARLAAVPGQVDQMISWMEQAEDAGAVPAGYLIDITISQLESDIPGGDANRTAVLAAFEDRIRGADLDAETDRPLAAGETAAREGLANPTYSALLARASAVVALARLGLGWWTVPTRWASSSRWASSEISRSRTVTWPHDSHTCRSRPWFRVVITSSCSQARRGSSLRIFSSMKGSLPG